MRKINYDKYHHLWKSEDGATQVIEMSFVLPLTMLVIIALVYLTFSMFLYVHLQGIAELAADSITDSFALEMPLSSEKEDEIYNEFSSKLKNLCVLPGMTATFNFDFSTHRAEPIISVEMVLRCFKGEIFTAKVERKVFNPGDFANKVDMISEAYKGIEGENNEIF